MSSYCPNPFSAGSTRHRSFGTHARTREQEPFPAEDRSHAMFLGESAAIRHLRSQVERIAPYFRTALLRGEPGSGKRLVAEALHRLGPGADAPFVVCSAASAVEALGTEPARSAMLLESARGGTLFLEEVGSLPCTAQAELVRLLASREPVRPAGLQRTGFGRSDSRGGEVRVIASTARDLRAMAAIGQFRSDLYARLSAIEIATPPLRQRREDLPSLAGWVLESISRQTAQPLCTLSAQALHSIEERSWSGNLRELEQVLTHAVSLAGAGMIEPDDLPHASATVAATCHESAVQSVRPDRLDDVIQQHVREVLARCGGNKLRAAELLGISRSTLYRMLEAGTPQLDGAA